MYCTILQTNSKLLLNKMKTQTPNISKKTTFLYSLFFILFIVFFTSAFSCFISHVSSRTVYAKYDKAMLFISSDCTECDEAIEIANEKEVEKYVDFEIYDIEEQEGSDQYENIVINTCQMKENITPVLYIDNECITQKTRLKTVIENIPEEVTKYNKGKKNTQILIYLLAGILIGLFILGKILKKEKVQENK